MKQGILCGVFAPIITPFDNNENISVKDLIFNIEKYNQTNLNGYMPLGSNGEFQGLTDEESILVLDTVYNNRTKDKVIVAGCGRESAYKTIEFIKKVSDHGLDMAFILPPHYFLDRMSRDSLYVFYSTVAQHSPVPVVIYNAPKFASNLLLDVGLIKDLSMHPNIAAMKNSSLEPNLNYIKAIPDNADFSIIAGNVQTFLPGLIDGVIGGVLSTASYMPEYCCELYHNFIEGDLCKAQEMHRFINMVSSQTAGKYGVAGVKYAMGLRGFYGGDPRIPLMPISPEEGRSMSECFEKFGIKPL